MSPVDRHEDSSSGSTTMDISITLLNCNMDLPDFFKKGLSESSKRSSELGHERLLARQDEEELNLRECRYIR
jgi:hypothetical protein